MSIAYVERPDGLGPPLGRYSHLAVAGPGSLVAVAGQVGLLADGSLAGDGGLQAQVIQTFVNLRAALKAASASPSDVLKTTTYLTDAGLMDDFMVARSKAFTDFYPDENYPPNTLVVVSRLVEPELLVEVEALALTTIASERP